MACASPTVTPKPSCTHRGNSKKAADERRSSKPRRRPRERRDGEIDLIGGVRRRDLATNARRSMLSQIERGEANPTIAVTSRIAQAFALSIGELLDGATAQPKIELIPTEDPAHIYRSDGQCYIRTLSPLRMETDIEIHELRLKPGAMLDSAPHFKGSREFLTVLSGTIAVTSDTDRRVPKKGASAHYQADVAHRIENTGRGEAYAFLVVTYE